jgi:ABC-type bacteriocin/lantibiotic exporter with double-glycine peptidase domain
MIKLDNVSFDYKKGNQITTLKNINLTVNKGELILLCGESGSGKTTITNPQTGRTSLIIVLVILSCIGASYLYSKRNSY